MTNTQDEVLERIARCLSDWAGGDYSAAGDREYWNRHAGKVLSNLNAAGLTVEQGWRSWSEVPQGVLEVDAYRPDAGVFVAVFRFLSDDVESWWASESGEDLTDDLPTHFRLRPTPPQEEG